MQTCGFLLWRPCTGGWRRRPVAHGCGGRLAVCIGRRNRGRLRRRARILAFGWCSVIAAPVAIVPPIFPRKSLASNRGEHLHRSKTIRTNSHPQKTRVGTHSRSLIKKRGSKDPPLAEKHKSTARIHRAQTTRWRRGGCAAGGLSFNHQVQELVGNVGFTVTMRLPST